MNISTTSLQLIIQALIAFVAGFFGSIAGGGGLLTLPAILTTGLSPQTALGTNKMLAALTTFSSSSIFIKNRLFNPINWLPAIVMTIISTAIGVIAVQVVSANFLNKMLPVVIILSAIYSVIYEPKKENGTNLAEEFKPKIVSSVVSSGVMGFYSGFIGAGLGMFWTSLAKFLYKLDIMQASGVARVMCFVSNLIAFIIFMFYGHVNYYLGLSMGIAMSCGSFIGAHVAIKFGGRFVKFIILTISIVMAFHLM